jgi:hypothetical protein
LNISLLIKLFQTNYGVHSKIKHYAFLLFIDGKNSWKSQYLYLAIIQHQMFETHCQTWYLFLLPLLHFLSQSVYHFICVIILVHDFPTKFFSVMAVTTALKSWCCIKLTILSFEFNWVKKMMYEHLNNVYNGFWKIFFMVKNNSHLIFKFSSAYYNMMLMPPKYRSCSSLCKTII